MRENGNLIHKFDGNGNETGNCYTRARGNGNKNHFCMTEEPEGDGWQGIETCPHRQLSGFFNEKNWPK